MIRNLLKSVRIHDDKKEERQSFTATVEIESFTSEGDCSVHATGKGANEEEALAHLKANLNKAIYGDENPGTFYETDTQ